MAYYAVAVKIKEDNAARRSYDKSLVPVERFVSRHPFSHADDTEGTPS